MKMRTYQVAHTGLACTFAVVGATLGFTAAASKEAAAQTPACEYDICNWGGNICQPASNDYNCRATSSNSCVTTYCDGGGS